MQKKLLLESDHHKVDLLGSVRFQFRGKEALLNFTSSYSSFDEKIAFSVRMNGLKAVTI